VTPCCFYRFYKVIRPWFNDKLDKAPTNTVRLPSYFTLQNVIPSITERGCVPQVSYSCVSRVILKTGTAEPVGLKSHSGDLAIHWPTSAVNCFTEDGDCPPFFWQHWFLSFQAWRNFTHLFCLTTDLCALLIPMLTQFIEMLLQFIGVWPCLPLLEDTIPLMGFGKPQQQAICSVSDPSHSRYLPNRL
jgi:hypothetical protein